MRAFNAFMQFFVYTLSEFLHVRYQTTILGDKKMGKQITHNKIFMILISAAMAFALLMSSGMTVFAVESEAPVLYLEVTNTLTAQDTFAWTEYDHYNFVDHYLPTLPKHINYNGNNIKMIGYSRDPFKDFLLVEDDDNSRKIFDFDIQRDGTDWHSMEGGGFLFNASVENNALSGFCVLITQNGLKLIEITGANLNDFRSGKNYNVERYGKLLKTYPLTDLYAEHHIKIEVGRSTVSLWDGDKLIIDKYALPENNYGFGYGPITSHASHSCRQQSYFTFSNIVMQTVTGYYIKLESTADKWGLTNGYWTNTFTLTNVEYTPDEEEIIMNFSEYPLFKNANDMVLFYPDGTYEQTPWQNGKADYENAKRYINVLQSNINAGTIKLDVGEQIIGAYAE